MSLPWVDLGQLDYERAWKLQEALLLARASGEMAHDLLVFVEHPHVFTLGRRGKRENLLDPTDERGRPIPIYDVNRGGDITYHGPGQLVGYPIVDLTFLQSDVIAWLRLLEAALIQATALLGLRTSTKPKFTGVWTEDQERKIASIGVGVKRNVSMHGFALNSTVDLAYFGRIVPCGLHGVDMTSLARELDIADSESAELNRRIREATVAAFATVMKRESRTVSALERAFIEGLLAPAPTR